MVLTVGICADPKSLPRSPLLYVQLLPPAARPSAHGPGTFPPPGGIYNKDFPSITADRIFSSPFGELTQTAATARLIGLNNPQQ